MVDGNWAPRPGRTTGSRRAQGWARGSGTRSRSSGDDFDQRTEYDGDEPVYQLEARADEASPDNPNGPFGIGSPVSHVALGLGRVVAVSGSGKDQRVVVDFGAIGTKTVFARYLNATDDSLN